MLVGIPSQFHLHRLEAAFELFAVLQAAWGLERVIAAAVRAPSVVTIAAGAIVGAAIILLALDRIEFLRLNTTWGEANLAAFQRERSDLDAALADVQAILDQRPGRVSAGKAAEWGATFKIGEAHVYSFLSRDGFDEASYLYHTISLTSDYMVLRNENDPAQEDFFAVRAVLAPVALKPPALFFKSGRCTDASPSMRLHLKVTSVSSISAPVMMGRPARGTTRFRHGCRVRCFGRARSLRLIRDPCPASPPSLDGKRYPIPIPSS
jgi:hypothetical protein